MRGLRTTMRAGAAVLAVLALTGCDNDVPTATGADLFPAGTAMTTVDLVLPASEILSGDTIFDDYADPRSAGYLLAANRFDAALDAHALVRFGGFPDSVTYGSGSTAVTDRTFTYGTGRITARIDTVASAPAGAVVLRLYTLAQPWDSATVTWANASRTPAPVAWQTPGGTLGDLVAEATWVPGDTVRRDTIVWQVDSLTMQKIGTPGFAGLAVTASQAGTRAQFSRLDLTANVHPASRPDTTLQVIPTGSAQAFVFDPPPPQSSNYRVGGASGARTILKLNLDHQVPSCAAPGTGCPTRSLRSVTLYRALLVLDPQAVPSGFRPTIPNFVQVRRLLEPELGRNSSLGEVLTQDSVPAGSFAMPGGAPTTLDVTNILRAYADSSSITLALLSVTLTPSFGTLWYLPSPRLRLVYTLPQTPKLP